MTVVPRRHHAEVAWRAPAEVRHPDDVDLHPALMDADVSRPPTRIDSRPVTAALDHDSTAARATSPDDTPSTAIAVIASGPYDPTITVAIERSLLRLARTSSAATPLSTVSSMTLAESSNPSWAGGSLDVNSVGVRWGAKHPATSTITVIQPIASRDDLPRCSTPPDLIREHATAKGEYGGSCRSRWRRRALAACADHSLRCTVCAVCTHSLPTLAYRGPVEPLSAHGSDRVTPLSPTGR